MRGLAHVYIRPHINTDEIIPARYLNEHRFVPLTDFAQELIAAGGLLPYVLSKKKVAS